MTGSIESFIDRADIPASQRAALGALLDEIAARPWDMVAAKASLTRLVEEAGVDRSDETDRSDVAEQTQAPRGAALSAQEARGTRAAPEPASAAFRDGRFALTLDRARSAALAAAAEKAGRAPLGLALQAIDDAVVHAAQRAI